MAVTESQSTSGVSSPVAQVVGELSPEGLANGRAGAVISDELCLPLHGPGYGPLHWIQLILGERDPMSALEISAAHTSPLGAGASQPQRSGRRSR